MSGLGRYQTTCNCIVGEGCDCNPYPWNQGDTTTTAPTTTAGGVIDAGACALKPEVLVCGSDGATYRNKCEARLANLSWTMGPCVGGPMPPESPGPLGPLNNVVNIESPWLWGAAGALLNKNARVTGAALGLAAFFVWQRFGRVSS